MRLVRMCLPLFLPLVLGGCFSHADIPPDKASYVGIWRHDPIMYLEITPQGEVHYRRSENGMSTKIDAPIQRFAGQDFEVGWWRFNATFIVGKTPFQEAGRWKMVVDGVTLTREGDCPACPATPPPEDTLPGKQRPAFRNGQRE